MRTKQELSESEVKFTFDVGPGIFVILLALVFVLAVAVVKGESPSDQALSYQSTPHKALDSLAEEYADQMAAIGSQSRNGEGHFGWSDRYNRALRVTGGTRAQEITAESWPGQPGMSWEDQWEEYAESWIQSPGHWSVASKKHRWIGTGSAMGRNGTWYGCLIAVD